MLGTFTYACQYIRSCVKHSFFFFQAEDGIRDRDVTGVQTCALPICTGVSIPTASGWIPRCSRRAWSWSRSEERRVGKECRSRRWPRYLKKKGISMVGLLTIIAVDNHHNVNHILVYKSQQLSV